MAVPRRLGQRSPGCGLDEICRHFDATEVASVAHLGMRRRNPTENGVSSPWAGSYRRNALKQARRRASREINIAKFESGIGSRQVGGVCPAGTGPRGGAGHGLRLRAGPCVAHYAAPHQKTLEVRSALDHDAGARSERCVGPKPVTSEPNELFDAPLPADRVSDKRSGTRYKFPVLQSGISAPRPRRLRKGTTSRSIANA